MFKNKRNEVYRLCICRDVCAWASIYDLSNNLIEQFKPYKEDKMTIEKANEFMSQKNLPLFDIKSKKLFSVNGSAQYEATMFENKAKINNELSLTVLMVLNLMQNLNNQSRMIYGENKLAEFQAEKSRAKAESKVTQIQDLMDSFVETFLNDEDKLKKWLREHKQELCDNGGFMGNCIFGKDINGERFFDL